jgi:small subunit ribosomal protein S4
LAEKQKAKYTYGILEKQFSNMFKASQCSSQGITGEILAPVVRTPIGQHRVPSWASPQRVEGARQLVSHRHIMVNGSIGEHPFVPIA